MNAQNNNNNKKEIPMKEYKIINKDTGEIRGLKFDNLSQAVEYVTRRNREGMNLGFVNKQTANTQEVNEMNTNPVNTNSPKEGTTMKTQPPASLVKCELLNQENLDWIISKLEEKVLPVLQEDVSNYAKGRMRIWMPYEAPLDSAQSNNRPFTPGFLDDEIWGWIVDLCAKHGFKAQTALISKGGNIKPHRDTTYADAWAMGINLGSCDWYITHKRESAGAHNNDYYHMSLNGGEVFKFNCKHVHKVENAAPDRWSINVWAIADTNAARQADIAGRLEAMLQKHPEVAKFIDYHENYHSDSQAEWEIEQAYEKHQDRLADKQHWIDEQNIEPDYDHYIETTSDPQGGNEMKPQSIEEHIDQICDLFKEMNPPPFEDERQTVKMREYNIVDKNTGKVTTILFDEDFDYYYKSPLAKFQIDKICDLFKQQRKFMTIDEQKLLINKMKGHIDGSAPLTFEWGCSAQEKLESYKPINDTEEVITMDPQTNKPKEETQMIKEYLVEMLADKAIVMDDIQETVEHPNVFSRVITNDPNYAFNNRDAVIIEEVNPGGYHWFMLDHMFGNESFSVEITSFKDPFNPWYQVIPMKGIKPKDVMFAWADFDAEYLIRAKGYSGDSFCDMSKYGLAIGNSAKMTKRLTEIIRAARGGMVNVKGRDKMARILVMTHSDILDCFPHLKTEEVASVTFDGISLITDSYAKKVYRANKYLSPKAKWQTLKAMDDCKITNHTIRVVTKVNGKPGMVKGNALSVPKEALLARLRERGMITSTQVVDIVTTVDNLKEELGTNGSWEIITLEPHHGPGMVKTNDQTLAQFKGIEGLFEYEHLLENFKSVLDNAYNNIVEGKDIEWMQSIVAERHSKESDKFASLIGDKMTSQMNKMIATLNDLGLDIGISQTLMFMRAQGILKIFLSDKALPGLNWQAKASEKKSFVYVPYAYRAYVMTKEVLWLAGYDIDLNDKQSFYHEETQTFCMLGVTWAKIQGKLGGADLDDEIMVHERRYVRPDGTVNPLVAFLVRTPNDWAEFAIVDLAEPGPAFLTDGDMPTINAKDLAKFKKTSVAKELPSKINGSDRPNPAIWNWDCARYNYEAATLYKGAGVGGQVKTKMLQYAINNAPFATLPCANEDMIDAIQQCKGSIDDLEVLDDWSNKAMVQVLQSTEMDAYFWYSRSMVSTIKALQKTAGLTSWKEPLSAANSPIVQEFMIPRELMVRETHQDMLNFLNRNIQEIPELENIFDSSAQEAHYRKLIIELSNLFVLPKLRDEYGNPIRADKDDLAQHMLEVTTGLLERMANYEERAGVEQTNLHVLRMVRASYLVKTARLGTNYDRWLYSPPAGAKVIMTDYFARALIWYRNKK